MTAYLFRAQGTQVFLSSQDPSYRYETLCGHCGYPIEPKERRCPRCRRELEDCPVCRERTHSRTPKVPAQPTGGTECVVCGILRYPVGHCSLVETDGAFCTNLYGCPAGGMLTSPDQVVYWPTDTPRCLVCKESELRPLPVTSFPHLVRRCLFCSAIFGIDHTWQIKLEEEFGQISRLPRVAASDAPCVLCGRNDDHTEEAFIRSNSVGPWGREAEERRRIPLSTYLRMEELGQALMLFTDNNRQAARHLYDRWFATGHSSMSRVEPDEGVKVATVIQHLLEGTLNREVRRVLRQRLDGLMDEWGKLQMGLGYVIAPQDS